jgi:cephalosporin-C deacetylase
MDNRGQGRASRTGDTPDINDGIGPHYAGFLSMGLDSPHHAYLGRLITDAVRLVDAARSIPLIDPGRIALTGVSHGGATSLAVSALVPDVQAVMPTVPTMCHFRRALVLTEPYREITYYLRSNPAAVETTMRTLGYFDGMNFAARASAPALFSISLMDEIIPPLAVFAAYNHYQGEKDVRVWEFSTHGSALAQHASEQLAFLDDLSEMKG